LGSIGHMSFGLAMRARMQVLGDAPVGRYFTVGSDTANDHLLRYWGKYFTHLDCTRLACRGLEETMWPLLESIQTLRTKHGNLDYVSAHNRYSLEYERLGMPPLLSITDEDLDRLQRVKVNWGIADRWLAVLHVRWDGLASRYGRNAGINDYLPAIKKIVTNGGAVIRIGSPAMPKLPKMEGVIDYAHDPQRLPWLDIAAIASSRFVVCTTSGPIGIAPCFGVPILWTNMPDIGKVVFLPKILTIPKLVRDPDGQTLSLEAMFKTGSAMMDSAPVTKSVLRYNEYSWIDNSPQDIADGVDEMLKNTWANPPCELDKLWRETLSKYGTEITSRPSPIFLKKYCNILFER
jgi:putative glycosyltransferase (TIGR04372 family)